MKQPVDRRLVQEYPCELYEALEKLQSVKNNIVVWWSATPR